MAGRRAPDFQPLREIAGEQKQKINADFLLAISNHT